MTFTDMLWQRIETIMSRILDHPFLIGLTDGTLSEEAFRFYATQDALYLKDYARGLALLAAKAPRDEWVTMFAEHARTTLIVERALHESFFRAWNLTEEQVYSTTPAPNNLLYTSYLLRVALERPFHEALGAFLPCYWIYWEAGKVLEEKGSPHSLFKKWIGTYASAEFGVIVQKVLAVTNEVAETLNEKQREEVARHFIATSKMEYLFWDMGHRRQHWEI